MALRPAVSLAAAPRMTAWRATALHVQARAMSSPPSDALAVTMNSNASARVVVPLPELGNTAFTVVPGLTVEQFLGDLKREDKALADARLFTDEGTNLAGTTFLRQAASQPMQLLLNDQIYVLDLTALHDDAAGDVDAALQPLVDRLSSSVRVMETEQLRRRRLQAALAEAEEELEPLEKIRKECLAKAHTSAKIRAWAGLALLGTQFGFLARLTWWEYSWDLMEPVTYFVGAFGQLIFLGYYVISHREFNYETLQNRIELKKFYDGAKGKGMDVARYNELKQRIEDCKRQLLHL